MNFNWITYIFLTLTFTIDGVLGNGWARFLSREVYKTVTRGTRKPGKIDIIGYRARIPQAALPGAFKTKSLTIADLQSIGEELHKAMETDAAARRTENDLLPVNDPKKRIASAMKTPLMLTLMRPEGEGGDIWAHSSLKGTGADESFVEDVDPANTHPVLSALLQECRETLNSPHTNEANCGEIMALNAYAKEKLAQTATTFDLAGIRNKLLVTVARMHSGYMVMSPCRSSTDPRTGQEKRPDDPRTWGCTKVALMAGYHACEIGWTQRPGQPSEMPTEEEVQTLIQGRPSSPGTSGTNTGSKRSLGEYAVDEDDEEVYPIEKREPEPAPLLEKPVQKVQPGTVREPVTGTPKNNNRVKKPGNQQKIPGSRVPTNSPPKTSPGDKENALTCSLRPPKFGGLKKGVAGAVLRKTGGRTGGVRNPPKTQKKKKVGVGARRLLRRARR